MREQRGSFRRTTAKLLGALAAGLIAGPSASAPDPSGSIEAGPGESAEAASVRAGDVRASRVRALIDGTLELEVQPQSLFDVSLADEDAQAVEAARLRALLRGAGEPDRDSGSDPASANLAGVHRTLFDARLDLDRARLDYYALDRARREEILSLHGARQDAAVPKETEPERLAREAEAERQRALEAAHVARTEAERVVAEELARLSGVESRVVAVREQFQAARDRLLVRQDAVLGWQRRVRDAKRSGTEEADTTYDALRTALRAIRQDMSVAIDALMDGSTAVPMLGGDVLADVPPDISVDEVLERRHAVEASIADSRREERALREEVAAAALDEMTVLNRERLGLLAHLSGAKSRAITGFTAAGWDQARSEARHLALILRYHQHVVQGWLESIRTGRLTAGSSWRGVVMAAPWLLLVTAFVWSRRRTPALLALADARLVEADRAERRTSPGVGRRIVHVVSQVHRPVEWIAFFTLVMWLLPSGARDLLEVQILASIVRWTVGGALIVHLINALAADHALASLLDDRHVGSLRLRSLRMVGRTIVAFTLVLVITDRLVGEGTIYGWVLSTCWVASIPVLLVLVHWWRDVVFDRVARIRKKSPVQLWVLENRSGWKSFMAATVGAIQLFGSGVVKAARGRLFGFDLSKRIHAYLYKREIDRLADGKDGARHSPPEPPILEALHPEAVFDRWIGCPVDQFLASMERRGSGPGGALIGLIGSRGMGKTSTLRALDRDDRRVARIACTANTTLADVRRAACIESTGDAWSGPIPRLVLLDDAQAFVKPVIGGLDLIDEVVALARAHCEQTIWVFALDAAIWPLLRRARDARPVLDETHLLEPWEESQIGALIADRCARAGIAPKYDDLLESLPPGSDEIDRMDALHTKRAGYERMIWDHVNGNPGLALEVWRSSLVQDAAGDVRVRSLQLLDSSRLDELSDSSLFILRAVLQLSPASVEDVALATRLSPHQVLDAFRSARAQGVLCEQEGRFRVTWPWLRAVNRVLERHRLLVAP